ncbi:MAG: efflux RND transporter periplasmic adaptor subunit [Bacteroidetes bacterium]|jgi:cobalt-zinc-cadmium efflux system membrane fusion protein|nr:efflux RND transporter periplasmic adaptor subunit [Bacteroidota bacterium]
MNLTLSRPMLHRLSPYAIGGLVLLLFAGMGCGTGADAPPADDSAASGAPSPSDQITLTADEVAELRINTITVEDRPVTGYLSLPARVLPEANQQAYVTSLVSGRVEVLRVGVGATVQQGQVLAEVTAPGLSQRVAALRQARDELDRQRRLQDRDVGLTKNLNAAERAWATARQELRSIGVKAARIERVARGEEDLSTLPMEAPMSGVVLDRMAALGSPVDEGMELFYIVDLQPIRVVADVFERSLAQVREGQDVIIKTPVNPDRTYEGTIAQLVPQVDTESRAVNARIRLSNSDGSLRPGMFATARVEITGEVQPVLPSDAIMTDESGTYVIVDEGNNTYRRQPVAAAADAEGSVVVPELAPGTMVVMEGAFQIMSAIDNQ